MCGFLPCSRCPPCMTKYKHALAQEVMHGVSESHARERLTAGCRYRQCARYTALLLTTTSSPQKSRLAALSSVCYFFYPPTHHLFRYPKFPTEKAHILYLSYFSLKNIVGYSLFRVARNFESSELPKMTSSETFGFPL